MARARGTREVCPEPAAFVPSALGTMNRQDVEFQPVGRRRKVWEGEPLEEGNEACVDG